MRGLHAAGAEGAGRGRRTRSRSPPACKAKLERLRGNCEYRNTADTVPTADSLRGRDRRRVAAASWNVLAEDYWDLYNLLLR